MKRTAIVLAALSGAALAAMTWREIPALKRYVKIARM